METRTISYHVGSNSNYRIAHNARLYKNNWPGNIDRKRSGQNIVLVNEPLAHAYHRLFDAAVEEYNAKQTRADRKVTDYLKSLQKSGKNPNYVYEAIVQFGDKSNSAQDNAVAKEVLQQYVQDFQQRNPQLAVIGAYIHLDEATPHLHLDWVPVGPNEGPKARGMAVVASMDKALRAQGYTQGKTRKDTPLARWTADERAAFDKLCADRGYNITHPQAGQDVQHLSVLAYKTQQEQQKLNDCKTKRNIIMQSLANNIERSRDIIQYAKAAEERVKQTVTDLKDKERQLIQVQNELSTANEEKERILQQITGLRDAASVATVETGSFFGKKTITDEEINRIEHLIRAAALQTVEVDKLNDKIERLEHRLERYDKIDEVAEQLGILDANGEDETKELVDSILEAVAKTPMYRISNEYQQELNKQRELERNRNQREQPYHGYDEGR